MHAVYHAIAWAWGGDHQGGPSGTGYLIASGVGAMIPGYAAFLVWLWRIRCEEPGCWRPGRHGPHKELCGKHWQDSLTKDAWAAIDEVRRLNE